MGLLKAHMDSVEDHLLSISRIPANTGHSLHKGTPREAFIREYLESHLNQNLAIGTGEIIDADSQPNVPRNQIDIVIYRRDYPRLSFGGGIHGFLAESVVATIEVKSTLDSDELLKSIRAARNVKSLKKNVVTAFHSGYQPPSVLSYVVAYDGPAKMQTVHGWLEPLYRKESIVHPSLPADRNARNAVASPSVDGVFVLGKGFVYFDNFPVGFSSDAVLSQNPDINWVVGDTARGSLLLLFLFLSTAASSINASWLNPIPYLSDFSLPPDGLTFGR
jgi:hypothetical protein